MKRLLCILDSLDTGGAETFMMKVYRQLDKDEYQIDFVVCEDGFYDSEVQNMGGNIYKIPLRRKHMFKSFFALKKIVKDNQYESVLKLGTTAIMFVDLLAAKLGGATHLCVRSCNANTDEGTLSKFINFFFCHAMNCITNVKIAPSDLAAEYTFGKKCVKKGEVYYLNNAVDLNVFYYDNVLRNSIRREFRIENKIVVGHIGRLNSQKNHAFLLDVFADIKSKRNDAVLLLVGKGELENEIKAKINVLGLSDSVIFTGVRSDVPALLSAMDVFVFPSFYEGMPNTVIEAQATGLPCIIADTITREADITGLVHYLPLGEAEVWAERALSVMHSNRVETYDDFIKHHYDIKSVTEQFTKLIYEAKK